MRLRKWNEEEDNIEVRRVKEFPARARQALITTRAANLLAFSRKQ